MRANQVGAHSVTFIHDCKNRFACDVAGESSLHGRRRLLLLAAAATAVMAHSFSLWKFTYAIKSLGVSIKVMPLRLAGGGA